MNRDYWISRWIENRIGFHRSGVNPLLQRFWPVAAPSTSAKTLVPFCGKSEDMRWLADRGHEVVGVDLSEIAGEAFGSEQGIAFTKTQIPGFTGLHSERITFYAGDFLDFTPDIAGVFDAFYDRAALIALPSTMRPVYTRHLQSLIAPGGNGLLITLEYDTSSMDGPPFSVSESEVGSLFKGFQVERLHEHDCLDEEPRFKERGLRWMKETVFHVLL